MKKSVLKFLSMGASVFMLNSAKSVSATYPPRLVAYHTLGECIAIAGSSDPDPKESPYQFGPGELFRSQDLVAGDESFVSQMRALVKAVQSSRRTDVFLSPLTLKDLIHCLDNELRRTDIDLTLQKRDDLADFIEFVRKELIELPNNERKVISKQEFIYKVEEYIQRISQ